MAGDGDHNNISKEEAKKTFMNIIDGVSNKSNVSQVLVGGASGWATGFILCKVGRIGALAVGGGFLMLQLAHHTGYVRIDWKKFDKDKGVLDDPVNVIKDTFNRLNQGDENTNFNKVKGFIMDNSVLTGGFAAGFLIGMAT